MAPALPEETSKSAMQQKAHHQASPEQPFYTGRASPTKKIVKVQIGMFRH